MSKETMACIPCGLHSPKRNTYYNGKLLVERDFTEEQIYHIAKGRLLNQVLHGTGTVCGLKISAHPVEECRDRFVTLEPGVALDCCGREIVVTRKTPVDVAALIEKFELQFDGTRDLFIAICYKEETVERVPLVLPDCDCAEQGMVPNRILESFELRLFAEAPGSRVPTRPPVKPKLDWLHTITLAEQSPRGVAVDDQYQQEYVAALGAGAGGGARIYVYRADNHDLITALNAGSGPTDLVVSDGGELIYLAGSGLSNDQVEGPVTGIALYLESRIRSETDPVAIMDTAEPVRLALSPRSGALFALKLESGQLVAWSEEEINSWRSGPGTPPTSGPANSHVLELASDFSAPDGPAMQGAGFMHVSQDGRFLFIIDPNSPAAHSVKVINIAKLFGNEPDAMVSPALPNLDETESAVAVRVSLDSKYVYLLTRSLQSTEEGDLEYARLRRYEWDSTLLHFIPSGRGGEWSGTPRDMTLAPTEKWAYVLQSGGAAGATQGTVQVVSIDEIASSKGSSLVNPLSESIPVSGAVRFQRLTGGGRKLYVAADDLSEGEQPERGLVAVLDVEEADCAELFFNVLDACPSCSADDQHQCVVLAHLPLYEPGLKMQNPEQAEEGDAVIDNFTYRPLVASSASIADVIHCMLKKGFAAGIPGPRGPAGEAGPGIVAAALDEVQPGPGGSPTAHLEDMGDGSGNQRLVLGIPSGLSGEDGLPGGAGPRGPGIQEVRVTTLAPGQPATAALESMPGDLENDLRLVLGIPRGAPGTVVWPDVTRIVALSWKHNEVSFESIGKFQDFMRNVGLVIAFDKPVLMSTIIRQGEGDKDPSSVVFELLMGNPSGCWCPVPRLICEPVISYDTDGDRRIVSARAPDPAEEPPESAEAVRLRLRGELNLNETSPLFRVVFLADFALDESRQAVDGNHIGGRVPERKSGNGMPGGTFRSWFEVSANR